MLSSGNVLILKFNGEQERVEQWKPPSGVSTISNIRNQNATVATRQAIQPIINQNCWQKYFIVGARNRLTHYSYTTK